MVLAREVSQCQWDGTTRLSVKAKIARFVVPDVRFWMDKGGISSRVLVWQMERQ